MTVILRIVKQFRGLVREFQYTSGSAGLLCSLEVYVSPLIASGNFILYFARDHVFLRFYAQRTGHAHKEDIARTSVGHAATPYAQWGLCNAQRLLVGIDMNVLLGPFYQKRRIPLEVFTTDSCAIVQGPYAVGHCLLENALVGEDDHLALHTWTKLVAFCIVVVVQDVSRDVAKVFVAERAQKGQCPFRIISMVEEESGDGLPVATRLYEQVGSLRIDALGFLCIQECGLISLAERILIGKTYLVLLCQFFSHRGEQCMFGRRHDVESNGFKVFPGK